ncbi:DUF29 domain-containing protein [Nostoc sp. CHAB 5715]|nr:DUF29 domain-containing protein [Nostoc sp. CHAB 5715]
MSDVAAYDTDILLWSERQAALLRDLKERARGLSNELDLENVAEEIESVGRSEFRAFESYLRLILTHVVKAASNPDPALRAKWRSEIFGFQLEARKASTPSMLRRIDLDEVWRDAVRQARIDMAKYDESLVETPTTCPLSADELLSSRDEIDVWAARADATLAAETSQL